MAIDPTKSGGIPAYDAARSAQAKAAARTPRDTAAPEENPAQQARAAADQVQLSAASRGLVETAQAPAPVEGASATGLSAERLKTVLERLQNGFYDRADVQDVTARGLKADLGTE